MDCSVSLTRDVLDEDLQIVRVTLAAISGDIRRLSSASADALEEALSKLETAQRELGGKVSSLASIMRNGEPAQ